MIEARFDEVKKYCSQSCDESANVQLPYDLTDWVRQLTDDMLQDGVNTDEHLPKELTSAWQKFSKK